MRQRRCLSGMSACMNVKPQLHKASAKPHSVYLGGGRCFLLKAVSTTSDYHDTTVLVLRRYTDPTTRTSCQAPKSA